MSDILLSYHVRATASEIDSLARKIAIEQSVEVPEALLSKAIAERYVGDVESIRQLSLNQYELCFSYQYESVEGQFNQLLNLCLGNISMYPQLRLVDMQLSDKMLSYFDGPQYGITGIRRYAQVVGRPLLATALKPRGLSATQFAQMAYEFAVGGGDIIKDDQNLSGHVEQYKQRVHSCQQALQKAAQITGRECLYFPYVSAPYEQLSEIFAWTQQQGIKGVLLAPAIHGFDHARGLAKAYQMIYMAHPSFGGSYCISPYEGISYDLFYGLLYRLAGVDISIFPNPGGRFNFSQTDCTNISQRCRAEMAHLKANFPCPAGGMQFQDISVMSRNYGQDTVFLLGGSLLQHSGSLKQSTREFLTEIERCTNQTQPQAVKNLQHADSDEHISSCDMPTQDLPKHRQLDHLCFDNFTWHGRTAEAYKKDNFASFLAIQRTELIGKQNEQVNFELRYFEIQAGGYTSLEKHQHTHVIIIVRGQGLVQIAEQSYHARVNDVLYIKPNCIHQLSNPHQDEFGFYCIVDKQRDRPQVM